MVHSMRACIVTVILFVAAFAHAISITITSPTNGTETPYAEFTLTADAADPGHVITLVEYYRNGDFVGSATNVPYAVTVEDLAQGIFTFTARAYNELYRSVDSPPVHVRVGDPPVLLARGPYLQSGSSTSMVIRWRTDWFTDSVVSWGTNWSALINAMTNT